MDNNNNFGFGFNDEMFSDRTLFIQLIPDSQQQPDPVDDETLAVTHNRKRLRLDSAHGHEAVQSNGNQSSTDYSVTQQIKTVHINTIILAAKSPFFFKLFSNGMAESKQRHVTLQIRESEEAAFMDMLKFMYTNTLSSTTSSALLDVLMAADKYEVESCMKYCIQLLHTYPMTFESANFCLNLPSTILIADTVQSLIDVAKEFLVARFNIMSKVQKEEEMLSLPLAGIEAVLSRDDLQVDSEDEIYDFVMKWARRHYTKLGERREILNTRLLRLIRFQFMSCRKLKEFLKCTDINLKCSSELIFDALSFQTSHQQLPRALQEQERAYKRRPVKVIRFNSPREECVVYLDLKHEECVRLYPSHRICSQPFDLSGQEFYLTGKCAVTEHSSSLAFGLGTDEAGSLGVEWEFSWRKKPSEEFVGKKKKVYKFTQPHATGYRNLFGESWDTFIAEDSPYFINGVLHLKAVLKIKKEVLN